MDPIWKIHNFLKLKMILRERDGQPPPWLRQHSGLEKVCLSTEVPVECSIIQSITIKNIWKPVMEFKCDVLSKNQICILKMS